MKGRFTRRGVLTLAGAGVAARSTLGKAAAPEAPRFAGTFRNRRGTPIADARVTLTDATLGFFREVRTDREGRYAIADAPLGDFQLGVAAPGYEYAERAVNAAGVDVALGPEEHGGRWSVVGDTEPETFGGTNSGVLMPDGRIIYCHDTVRPVVFNPITGDKSLPHASPSIQGCHMVTVLTDGRVLYVGGGFVTESRDYDGQSSYRTVKAFDPATDTWSPMPEMNEPRWYPGLARLADGRLLVFGGGQQPARLRTNTCEIFDPATQTWTPTGSLLAAGGFGPTMLLPYGDVLVTWFPPQRYDVAAGTWRETGSLVQPLRSTDRAAMPTEGDHPDHTAILLPDGRVAAIGVRAAAMGGHDGSMVEIYDPATET